MDVFCQEHIYFIDPLILIRWEIHLFVQQKPDKQVGGVREKVSGFTLAELKQMGREKRVGPEWKDERIPIYT